MKKVYALVFALALLILPTSSFAYGGGVCINCGFVQPIEVTIPTTVCYELSSTPLYTFNTYLSLNSIGQDVIELQKELDVLGYTFSSVTGRYDVLTMIDVIYLQRANELERTGSLDAATRAVLNAPTVTEKCEIVYETVRVENRLDLQTLRDRISQVIQDIIDGKGLGR